MAELQTRISPRKRFDFDELAPWAEPWAGPSTPDLLFGLLRRFIALATRDDEARNRRDRNRRMRSESDLQRSRRALLHNHTAGWDATCAINPARWRSSVREILGAALAARPAYLTRAGFALGRSKVVAVPHRVVAEGEWNVGAPVDGAPRRRDVHALADYVGRLTRAAHNDCHKDVRRVCRVLVRVDHEGYSLFANIAEVEEQHHRGHDPLGLYAPYTWTVGADGDCHGPAVGPVEGEAFGAFVERAHAAMERLLEPPDEVKWFAWTVLGYDAGNEHRPPRPAVDRPEAYVLAPTEASAVDYWRAHARLPESHRLCAEANAHDPAALLPPVSPGRDHRCAVALRCALPGLEGFSPAGHNRNEILRTLLNLARAPYRSTLHCHRESVWRDAPRSR